MKRKLLILCILFTVSLAGTPHIDKHVTILKSEPINPYLQLWEAVCSIESGHNQFAYNPLEGATGIAQIRQCKLDDYNQATGKSLQLTELFDPDKSKDIFLWHCQQFSTIDLETAARRWNGSGEATNKYWQQIKSRLNLP